MEKSISKQAIATTDIIESSKKAIKDRGTFDFWTILYVHFVNKLPCPTQYQNPCQQVL